MKLFNLFFLFVIGTLGCQSQSSNAPHPILATVQTGDLAQIEKFLEGEGDINAHYAGYTLLCAAVKTDQKEIVVFLVAKEANLNKMSNQKTPLMYAAKYGRLVIAKLLIEKGADKTAVSDKGKTALDYAEKYEQSALVTLLSK